MIPLLATILVAAVSTGTNHPPDAPVITEPGIDGMILNPADVHMETAPFSDPDPGDQHRCTDWDIWRVSPAERVWFADCITGIERIHIHLGDGTFEGSHTGWIELQPNTDFLLRVRHSDDSGDAATEWSPWSSRPFRTGSANDVFPFETDDVVPAPAPRWIDANSGVDVVLQPAPSSPALFLESAAGALLLSVEPNDGVTNTVTNPGALPAHVAPRIRLEGGSSGLTLPATDLVVSDDHCTTERILLPATTVAPGATRYYWISSAGATYVGTSSQISPDFSVLARGLPLPWSVRHEGFRVDVFAGGFTLPVNIVFVPNAGPNPGDPFLYVTELYGTIQTVARDGTVNVYATDLLDFDPSGAFPGSGEQGLTGIAVDPATGDVYASLLHTSASNSNDHEPKIVRFTSSDGGRTASTQTTILDMIGETQGQSHQISDLTFGPDGKLLCHMGDGFVTATGQDLDSFRGKILHLNLDGSPSQDNPFYDASDGISARDYVYCYGLRNPFGGDWRAADGFAYEVENGPSVDRFAKLVRGRNYLWNGSDASMANFAIYNWSPAHGPVNLAFVQPETFGGSGFPPSMMGHAFISESGPTYANGQQSAGKRISEWVLDASGNLVAGPIPFLEYAGTGRATACGLEAGPDGLYMTELYYDQGGSPTQPGARILRVRWDLESDCNANGIDDACDLAAGTSADVNGNGVPDECESSVTAFCFGDGSGIACPCGNIGLPGHGCENSSATGGAVLSGSGHALLSADTLQLSAAGERASALSVFWQATAETGGSVFGDGVACLGGQLKRLYVHGAVGGVVTGPQGADLSVSARSAALGSPIAPGATRVYHVFYRDPDPSFCSPPFGSTINTTNGLRVLWGG
jgi:glucose/arabinose dehydrogenase